MSEKYDNIKNLIRHTPQDVMGQIRILAMLESAATGHRVTQQALVNRILAEYVEAHKINLEERK